MKAVRTATTKALAGLELPSFFALATLSSAANAKGTANDRRRNDRKARAVAAYLEAAEDAGGASTEIGQRLLLKAASEHDRSEP